MQPNERLKVWDLQLARVKAKATLLLTILTLLTSASFTATIECVQ